MNSEKAQRMFTLIDQWRASGQRRDEFCRQHQIKVSTSVIESSGKTGRTESCREDLSGLNPLDPLHHPNRLNSSIPTGSACGLAEQTGR